MVVADSAPGWVLGDPNRLRQILANLLANALRYTERGVVTLTCVREGEMLRMAVRDTGIGIAEEHLPHIFEEYYQVGNKQRDRSKGLGLGLAIVKKIIEEHGGVIWVDTSYNAGAGFVIQLPAFN